MLIALFNVADLLLRVLGWIIIIQVILSWLVAFNVLNTGSQGLRAFVGALDRINAAPSDGRSDMLATRQPARLLMRIASFGIIPAGTLD